jgi:hypothetical protein
MAFLVQGGAPPDDSVTTAKIKDDAVTAAKVAAGVLPAKNLIINGDMRIAQRGTSFAGPSANDYTLDRFSIGGAFGSGVVTITQDTDVPDQEFAYSLKVDVTTLDSSIAAGETYSIQHKVEGFNFVQAAFGTSDAKTVTLSFWVKSTKTGTFCVGFRNSAANRAQPKEYTVSSADTWEKKTITLAGDTTGTWVENNGTGLIMDWSLGTGSNFHGTVNTWEAANDISTSSQVNAMDSASNNFFLTGVQLEVGSAASDFEHRDYGSELARCQRYFERWVEDGSGNDIIGTGWALDTSSAICHWPFKVTKRSTPTISFSNTAHFRIWYLASFQESTAATTYQGINADGVMIDLTTASASLTAGDGLAATSDAGGAGYIDAASEL